MAQFFNNATPLQLEITKNCLCSSDLAYFSFFAEPSCGKLKDIPERSHPLLQQ